MKPRMIRGRSMAVRPNGGAIALLVAAITLACSGSVCAGDLVTATVEQPRAFGHVLGDVLSQRVLLEIDGHDAGEVTPPSNGRIDVWFERRKPYVETDREGRRWMVIDYQLINAPETLTEIRLPPVRLTSKSGKLLQVTEWPVSVGPLTPRAAFDAGDLRTLRPDRLVPSAPMAPIKRRLLSVLALLTATLAAWVGWWFWRNRRDAHRLPFALAWQKIQNLKTPDVDSNADAWLCVHRALDETAGHVVHAGALTTLFTPAPYLEPLRPELETFYARSRERFFGNDMGRERFALRDFCRALYRAERRRR